MSRAIETLVLCIVAASVSYEPHTATPAVQVAPAVKTIADPATSIEAGEVAGILETTPEPVPQPSHKAQYIAYRAPSVCGPNGCGPATAARGYQRQTYRSGPIRRLFRR